MYWEKERKTCSLKQKQNKSKAITKAKQKQKQSKNKKQNKSKAKTKGKTKAKTKTKQKQRQKNKTKPRDMYMVQFLYCTPSLYGFICDVNNGTDSLNRDSIFKKGNFKLSKNNIYYVSF